MAKWMLEPHHWIIGSRLSSTLFRLLDLEQCELRSVPILFQPQTTSPKPPSCFCELRDFRSEICPVVFTRGVSDSELDSWLPFEAIQHDQTQEASANDSAGLVRDPCGFTQSDSPERWRNAPPTPRLAPASYIASHILSSITRFDEHKGGSRETAAFFTDAPPLVPTFQWGFPSFTGILLISWRISPCKHLVSIQPKILTFVQSRSKMLHDVTKH